MASLEILKLLSDATTKMVDMVSPSIVSIGSRRGLGTGVIWNSDGYIVTCNHVLGRGERIMVGLGDDKNLLAEVIGRDPYSDIALLKIRKEGIKPIELGDSNKISVGQFVLALANPYNRQPGAASGIITNVKSSLRVMHETVLENMIITDAQLNPGYSGGPLVDAEGKMIGLNTAVAWSRGLAIPINTVKQIVNRLAAGGTYKRGYLGIALETISLPDEIRETVPLRQETAIMVYSVEAKSPARKAGLAFGDIMVGFNNEVVEDPRDLLRLLAGEVVGKEIKMKILRGEKLMELTIVPCEGEDEDDDQ